MNKTIEKFVWYENPKYYLASILLLLGFRQLIDIFHLLSPSIGILQGSIINFPLIVIMTFALALFLRKT